jgi:hypothetical protein
MEQRLNTQENKVFNVVPKPQKDTKELPKKLHSLHVLQPRLIRKGTCVGKTKETAFSLSSSS